MFILRQSAEICNSWATTVPHQRLRRSHPPLNSCRKCYARCLYSQDSSQRHSSTHLDRFRHAQRRRSRSFHASSSCLSPTESSQTQAIPLTGYYADLLTPSSSPSTRASPSSTSPPPTASSKDRAKILFGTGSRRYVPTPATEPSAWRTINGVPIPPRPSEPDNCCMSGCMHCVWDDYRDSIEEWAGRIKSAQQRSTPHQNQKKAGADASSQGGGQVPPKQRVSARREFAEAATSMDDDGGGSETNWDVTDEDEDNLIGDLAEGRDLFESIPVGIREFMKTEKRLRELHMKETGELHSGSGQ